MSVEHPPAEILEARELGKRFVTRRNVFGRSLAAVDAVADVSLTVRRGETFAIVGESGAGKSTLGRMLLRLVEPDRGTVRFEGIDLRTLGRAELRRVRARARMIFQDPFLSLDPKMSVGASVGEALRLHLRLRAATRRDAVAQLFERVGLNASMLDQRPSELSGGQLQRVAIARAISTNPSLVVADEPVAALDMSLRARVINLLREIQRERELAMVFVSHDLALVRMIADRVAVMYRGRVVESGPTAEVIDHPRHPYTATLVASMPQPRRPRSSARTELINLADVRSGATGCDYSSRCPYSEDACLTERPPLEVVGDRSDRAVACRRNRDLADELHRVSTGGART